MTSGTKHTPGPWEVTNNTADGYGQLVVDSMHGAVAICYTAERGIPGAPSECIANAHLIAAAPELLAALRELVDNNMGQPKGVTVPQLDKARTDIAKATGEG